MKLSKTLKAKVATKYGIPILIITVVAAVGVIRLSLSHAATVTRAAILDSNSVIIAPGISVGGLTVGGINFVGAPQITYVSAGAKLSYNQGIKGNVTECYFVQVLPDKAGNGTAWLSIASNNKVSSQTITYDSTNPNALQRLCVGSGKSSNPGYNIYNMSSTQGIIVYQAIVTY